MSRERKPVSQTLRKLYATAIPDGDRDDLRKLEHWFLDYGSAIVTCLEALERIASSDQTVLRTPPDMLQMIARRALRSFDGGD